MLSTEELGIIKTLSISCPYLWENFQAALAIPASDRYEWAQDRVYDIYRLRYAKRGVPLHDTETVGEHTLEAIGLATLHTPDHCNSDTVEEMLLVHDLPQAILDNLRCEDIFTQQQKQQVTKLAAKVIFEKFDHAYALWNEYEEQKTLESHVAKDIQNAQMMLKILEYKQKYPEIISKFKSFFDNLENSWLTKTGHEIYLNTYKNMSIAA